MKPNRLPTVDESLARDASLTLARLMERDEATVLHFVVESDVMDEVLTGKTRVYNVACYSSLDRAQEACEQAGDGHGVVCINALSIRESQLTSALESYSPLESLAAAGVGRFTGIMRGAYTPVPEDPEEDDEPLTEGRRAAASASSRLRRTVLDKLNRSRTFRKDVTKVKVSGNKMTVHAGGEKHVFKVHRGEEGWVEDVEHVKGNKRRMSQLLKHVKESFKSAHFQQILQDASGGDKLRLVMLDYTRLNGGRRTRLIESYSYRYRPSTGRTYLYGWNVEEGGIRSYIVDRINGARITDRPFQPRFLVEIAPNFTSDGPLRRDIDAPEVVTKAVIKRAHERFELAGGRGKIIRRLGHSVERRSSKK